MGARCEFGKAEVFAHETKGGGFEDSGIRLVEVARSILRIPITDLRFLLLLERESQRLPMVVGVVGGGDKRELRVEGCLSGCAGVPAC